MTDSKLRVMADANVLFAALYSPRFPYEVLRHAIDGQFQLLLTDRIIREAHDAIAKVTPKKLAQFRKLIVATQYESIAKVTAEEIKLNAGIVRDEKDIHVAVAAIKANADYLITSDKDFTDPNQPIQQKLKILLPGTFLRLHMGWTSEALEQIRLRKWEDSQ